MLHTFVGSGGQLVSERDDKLLNVFNIVKFPNDGCNATSGSYGVCYTSLECSSLGGTSSGSCASGFGVCCLFSGGCGATTSLNNTYFKSSTRRKPEIAEVGGQGERLEYTLELRTMADVGLIGFPNAGKSTLLTAISRARPKVAAYPFTTLNPHIGMVQYSDLTQLAVADLPGLLPGAHKNHGLGIAFLRHIERCSLLLYVLDMGEEEPWKQLGQLKFELDAYSPGLSSRPSAVIANKMDLEESGGRLTQLEEYLGSDATIIPISGKMGDNLTHLLVLIKQLHDDYVAMHQAHVQV